MIRRIFVFVSIIFLSFMICFYGYKLIYFYNLEQKGEGIPTLTNQIITRTNKLVSVNDEYYFKGNANNNYVYFSGMYYRIISFNDFNITLICDEDVTKLKYGSNESYKESDIKKWLDDIYKKNINNKLVIDNSITLLNKDIYQNIGGIDSFIESSNIWILDNDKGLVLSEDGSINVPESYNYYLNVRPVIKVKNINYINGNGTIDNPYILESKEVKKLNDVYVGNYITYKDKTYRVINNDGNIKVVSTENIGNHIYSTSTNNYKYSSKNDLYYYLNTTYLTSLNKDNIVLSNWNNGPYNTSFKDVKSYTMSTYVGLLSIGDYFINNIEGYTLSKSGNYIYTIKEDGNLFIVSPKASYPIYPSFTLKGDLKINNGDGTIDFPYEVGE